MNGLKVLCNTPDEDYFSRILGYEEYKTAIENTNGDAEKLKDVFWNVLADDYCWEFVNGEIVLRGGMTLKASGANQNLMLKLFDYVRQNKLGNVFGGRCVCDLGDNFFSPNIGFFDLEKSTVFNGETNRFPVPNFVVEVNDESCEKQNRGVKFEEYAKFGVEEYWLLNPKDETIEQYRQEKGRFDFLGLVKKEQYIESIVLKGFRISLMDIFNDN